MKTSIIMLLILAANFFACAQSENKREVDGWFAGGDPAKYETGIVKKQHEGKQVYYLKSLKNTEGDFGTFMRNTTPASYYRKRLRLSGLIKCEDVVKSCGMWMRVDGRKEGSMLGFDNMQNRPITGTMDWQQFSIVLDVPDSSINIAYGILLIGNGSMWMSDMKLETVGNDVAVTNILQENFPNNSDEWFKAGSKPGSYEIGAAVEKHNSNSVYFIKSIVNDIEGFGTIMRNEMPNNYIGKRVRLTGEIKTENISDYAGMWMRIDGTEREKMLGFDNMYNRPIKGTNDWTKYEIVLDVPDGSTNIAYGLLISKTGSALISNFKLEIVGTDIPVTNTLK